MLGGSLGRRAAGLRWASSTTRQDIKLPLGGKVPLFPNISKYDIVVVGGGPAGLAIASHFRFKNTVAVIEPSDTHYYQPLWTLVGAGLKDAQQSAKPMEKVIPEYVTWFKDSATGFDPEKNLVKTKGSGEIAYDYLVVASGINVDFGGIKGLKESIGKDGVCSNYSYQYAPKTWEFLQEAAKKKDGAKLVFTFPNTPVKCAGAPQKIMYLADNYLRQRGVRDKASFGFFSPLPKIFGVDEYAAELNKICDKRNLYRYFGKNLVEVRASSKEAVFQSVSDGSTEVVPYDFLHVTPPHAPHAFLKGSPIANAAGFVDVDKHTLQHVKYPNVFSIGDCSSLPTSKTAAAITAQAGVLQRNLYHVMNGFPVTRKYDGYTSCPLVTSDRTVMLAEFDYDLKRAETFPFDQRTESNLAYLLKSEVFPFLYWNFLLKGIWKGPKVLNYLP